jgi:hypothetical protein
LREGLLDAARRREIDVVLVWRLERWGRSVADLLATLQELDHLGAGFVSLTEALDLTTPAGLRHRHARLYPFREETLGDAHLDRELARESGDLRFVDLFVVIAGDLFFAVREHVFRIAAGVDPRRSDAVRGRGKDI